MLCSSKVSNSTHYCAVYKQNIARANSLKGRYMKDNRQSTVEPVFGTLTQFMELSKINTISIKQANKCMQLSAINYNLKKHLKFTERRCKSRAAHIQAIKTILMLI
ncbi:transposase [Lacinutrix sp. C3R15]|nr:transposase [Lacinutrix sp. C3R15]